MPKTTTGDYAIPKSLAVSIENITLNNIATSSYYGSIIFSGASELNITNCIFDSMYSSSSYYGIVNSNGILNIKNSTFNNLTVTSWNLILGSKITIDNSSFTNCTAYRAVISGVRELYNSQIINCTSKSGSNWGIISTGANAILENNTFINNSAVGGVIFSNKANIINNTFIDNKISSRSIINANSNTNIANSKFINNTGAMGGAIYANALVNLTGNTFENNLQSGY